MASNIMDEIYPWLHKVLKENKESLYMPLDFLAGLLSDEMMEHP